MTGHGVVLSQRRGQILLITLNRPRLRNSVDGEMARGIAAAIDELDGDDELRVGVMTGAGEGFCAGADLETLGGGDIPFVDGRGFAGLVEAPPGKPLVAAVEGFAMGGGLEIALACDLMVAARGAQLGLPEVRHGLLAVGGGLLELTNRVGRAVAMELALTGVPIDAQRGHELGLVNRLAEPGEALGVALALASTIARNAPGAVMSSKRVVAESPDWKLGERWRRQEEIAAPAFASEDVRIAAAELGRRLGRLWAANDQRQGVSE